MKRIFTTFLSLVLILTFSISASAASIPNTNIIHSQSVHKQFTKTDILSLETYISVDNNGFYSLDSKQAIFDGVDELLLEGQQKHFNYLNSLVKDKKIVVTDNLEIKELVTFESKDMPLLSRTTHYNCGGGINTPTENHWWGYSRYSCDCQTRKIASRFSLGGITTGGAGSTLSQYFSNPITVTLGLGTLYWGILANRLNANNHGKGVFTEMTWAFVFDITPQ